MKDHQKYLIVFFCFMIIGCSAISYTLEPTKYTTRTELPTYSLENIKHWTITPTVTNTFTPTYSQLPYTMVEIKGTKEELALILFREAQNAKKLGRAPYIQIYADWCPSCRALERSMKDERMIEAYRGTYVILANIDVWRDQFPKNELYVTGVPTIFELTYEGKPTGRFITGSAWGENIPENMAPPLDRFFHPD
jgi:thiol-disulfide isomerase/thioredoxin